MFELLLQTSAALSSKTQASSSFQSQSIIRNSKLIYVEDWNILHLAIVFSNCKHNPIH